MITGEGGGRVRSYLGILGQIRVTPRWADDSMLSQEGEDNGEDRTLDGNVREQGGLMSVCNNRLRILGTEWSMSEVGTPPPYNLDKPHRMVDSIINNNNTNVIITQVGMVLKRTQKDESLIS